MVLSRGGAMVFGCVVEETVEDGLQKLEGLGTVFKSKSGPYNGCGREDTVSSNQVVEWTYKWRVSVLHPVRYY